MTFGRGANDFNPRTPCGVRRRRMRSRRGRDNFNPRTPCGVRRDMPVGPCKGCAISIHAPLAGCDVRDGRQPMSGPISIHAPLAGCDKGVHVALPRFKDFNPRTPCGVRRLALLRGQAAPGHFNPRTPCGVRHRRVYDYGSVRHFNPRTPCGVRLRCLSKTLHARCVISIHAPLAGCDDALPA